MESQSACSGYAARHVRSLCVCVTESVLNSLRAFRMHVCGRSGLYGHRARTTSGDFWSWINACAPAALVAVAGRELLLVSVWTVSLPPQPTPAVPSLRALEAFWLLVLAQRAHSAVDWLVNVLGGYYRVARRG